LLGGHQTWIGAPGPYSEIKLAGQRGIGAALLRPKSPFI
jgi:hypothetical protein